jgi:integrase
MPHEMARQPRPWLWAERNCYAATVRGRRRILAEGTDEDARARAVRELHRLLAMDPEEPQQAAPSPEGVADILDRFHDNAIETLAPDTSTLYGRRLAQFKAWCGTLEVSALRHRHLGEWLASRKTWNDSTRRTAAVIICTAFSWASKQGYIPANPLAEFAKPRASRRQAIPTAADVGRVLEARMSPAFRDFFTAIWMTGCRPGEAAKVRAEDFDPEAATWTIQGKTTRKTGRMRVVILPPEVVAICRRLAEAHPAGPLFLNSRGRPWKGSKYGEYLRELRKGAGIGPEMVAYGLRHLFATDALERGVPIATVAELLGHTNTLTVSRSYSHLSKRTSHLRDAVEQIRPDPDRDTSSRKPGAGGPGPSSP